MTMKIVMPTLMIVSTEFTREVSFVPSTSSTVNRPTMRIGGQETASGPTWISVEMPMLRNSNTLRT